MQIDKPLNLMIFLLLALLVGSCGFMGSENENTEETPKKYTANPASVVGLAKVVPVEGIVPLHPQVPGIIYKANVTLGDSIRARQVLFEIKHDVEDGQIALTEAQLATQAATIRELEVSLEKTESVAASAGRTYRRIQAAFEQGVGTKQAVEDAETNWQSALYDEKSLKAKIETARAQRQELQASLNLAKVNLEKYFVRSPSDGVILKVSGMEGSMASPNVPLCEFTPHGPMGVHTEVDELFANRVEVGQRAYIRLQGSVDTLAMGKVISMSPSLHQKSLFADEVGKLEDRRVREVHVKVENGHERLLYGQRVECWIDLE